MCFTAYRYVQDRQSAEDVVQEVFIKMWSQRSKLRDVENLEAYIRRSTVNASLNYLKKHNRIQYTDDDESLDRAVVESTADIPDAAQRTALVQQAIQSLPDRCRLIFTMSRYDGLSYREIADNLDLSIKTVENQVSKALKVLRESLKSLKT